jgi:ABC-type amino acid transport substrate-binding protein
VAKNPNTLRKIHQEEPLRIDGVVVVIKKDEPGFATMLNAALTELTNTGRIEKLIAKYNATGSFYPVKEPYKVPI